ncbi:MAG: hypothetical protein OXU70_18450 [Gammaproteobacteria bacterium]|nr:hypothetical protein [Gammaproteobacteria bacterium]
MKDGRRSWPTLLTVCSAFTALLAGAAGCMPIDPAPLHWSNPQERLCGALALRFYPGQGVEIQGHRFGEGEVHFTDEGAFATAGVWQRTSEFPDGRQTYFLNETRYALADGELHIAIEKAPTSAEDAEKLAARDYSHPFPAPTPASQPIGQPSRPGSALSVTQRPCVTPDGPLDTAADVTVVDLILMIIAQALESS